MWACDQGLSSTIVNSYEAVPVFANVLQSFLAAQCALVGDHLWPEDATEKVMKDPYYDFIVVGAGSAGAVVANRLSEVPHWKVLLVEAGGNPTIATEIPQLFLGNMNTTEDWGYTTQPQAGACRSYKNKGCAWPRGKTLGGSSSINAMYYVRGNKQDYEEWAANGNSGWSYNDVLPYFKKSENFSKFSLDDDAANYHGIGGYLSVENTERADDFEKIIIEANKELGTKILRDINGGNQMGVTQAQSTTKDGIRHSTARAFLNPVKDRPNLHVMKNAYVTKILFKDASNSIEADGVLVSQNGIDINVKSRKEVIISAGAINTPKLLLLSGIGPKKQLEDLGLSVIANLPVGENLQDHAFVPIYYTLKGDKQLTSLPNIVNAFAEYILNKKGPFSALNPNTVISFINTTDSASSIPDVQHHYFFAGPSQSNVMDAYKKHGVSEEFNEKVSKVNENNFILAVCTVLLKPKSKGRIVLNSNDPYDSPLIYANYFDDPEDLETIINGIKYVLKFADTKIFKDVGFKLHWVDLEACQQYDKQSDTFLECMARETTFSLYHPVGTAKMGPHGDDTAVVDPDLKVKGVERLRVIDASVMPSIVRGNTNAPVIMIGEKGADLIKKDWLENDRDTASDSSLNSDKCQNVSLLSYFSGW
ncbi:unnamed protein product [Plutella xylostella]|uniref:(diamondback moth) hypothetical protein n=1 Tax=Plutella xylostella TaxID=51655 RepID=A0A8S4DTF1_PLUXY|nr:unnamed protein product [Plutella xylostella]